MPLIMPEARCFSMPSSVVGGAARRKVALNCRPWVRSLTQVPEAWTNSPALIVAAALTTVTRSRWPRTLTRSTQKPFSALWYVTRSTRPARASRSGAGEMLILACSTAVTAMAPALLGPWNQGGTLEDPIEEGRGAGTIMTGRDGLHPDSTQWLKSGPRGHAFLVPSSWPFRPPR